MIHQIPQIVIQPHTQKSRSSNLEQNGVFWPDIIKKEDLDHICALATGQNTHNLVWLGEDDIVSSGGKKYKYNVGNVVIIDYLGTRTFITLGNPHNDGRNSYFQQIGPAFRRFIECKIESKKLIFYGLPIERPKNFGQVFTLYHHFMYAILKASGIEGNWNELLGDSPREFRSIEHLISFRNRLSKKNNNASYVYYDVSEDTFYLFLKTFGASKYESFFLALAAINIEREKNIQIRELEEGELTGLPTWASEYLETVSNGKVKCHSLDIGMDEHRAPVVIFPPSLRTPRHRVNVRRRCGEEECCLCANRDPRDIQAAHIWDVHKLKALSLEEDDNQELWDFASDGDNGLWLCTNHHRAFDNNTLMFDLNGRLMVNTLMSFMVISTLTESITKKNIDPQLYSNKFKFYLCKRMEHLDLDNYRYL